MSEPITCRRCHEDIRKAGGAVASQIGSFVCFTCDDKQQGRPRETVTEPQMEAAR
jgi:hypothetical protein